ncbi:histidine phosphatase family protein [Marinivivus vitaminiproducens]|uniref:histidine phosphatase family protein n=1 Tax=Marinivivus vitaminiproducens TaxID=3035935 RepID=UPI00279CE3E4|nr:histidine phosphatase family protein [Geminicoccaceae bacterium SCSIO 64248]
MIVARHAQSVWNLHFGRDRVDPGIPDAPLTELGHAQALDLARRLAEQDVRRVVASPYTRTLQTASIVGRTLDVPVAIEPLVRERNAFSCDQGSSPEALVGAWPDLVFDGLAADWFGTPIETLEQLRERCGAFARKAASWADFEHVAVISHWGFIRGLTGQEITNAGFVRLARPI